MARLYFRAASWSPVPRRPARNRTTPGTLGGIPRVQWGRGALRSLSLIQ